MFDSPKRRANQIITDNSGASLPGLTGDGSGRKMKIHIAIGGLVAAGFDATGQYLLVVSHAGRGVFSGGAAPHRV